MKEQRRKKAQKNYTKKLVSAALFAAICYGMTLASVPLPVVGYGNLGDCFVLLSGCLLGPLWGAAAAALGSALADVTLGFGIYAPATFIIKGLMAAVAYFAGSLLSGTRGGFGRRTAAHIVAALLAELIMIGGYFAYETVLYDMSAALGSVIGNSMQAIAGIVLSTVILAVIRGNRALNNLFEGKGQKEKQ